MGCRFNMGSLHNMNIYEYRDKLKESLDLMVRYYLSTMEGDTHKVEDAYALMYELGYVDEDGFEL